jgi:hypothetical protein
MLLAISAIPGCPVKSVAYFVDNRLVAQSSSAPFSARADLSGYKTGTRLVKARITDTGGNTFDSPVVSFAFTNQPDDAAQALAAKQASDRAAAIEIAQANAEAAQAQADAAAEAAKDRGPMGPARKALRQYLATHEGGDATLVDVKDVRKSDSEIYPSDIYAVVADRSGNQLRIIYSANLESGEFSEMTKKW